MYEEKWQHPQINVAQFFMQLCELETRFFIIYNTPAVIKPSIIGATEGASN